MKDFNYLIDGLTFDKVGPLYRALMTVKEINFFNYDFDSKILAIRSIGDQTESVEIALEIVGATLRGNVESK